MLPLSNNPNLSKELGMRHRAGIGMSEASDAVVVIVSEETGAISVAVNGMLKRHLTKDTFEKILRNELIPEVKEEPTAHSASSAGKKRTKPMNNSNETKERKKLDLKRITDSRVFWMILSLLAASLLWMYVTTTEGVEVEKTLTGVKIEFLGADAMRASSDLIVTEQDRTTVNLTLSGTRRVLSKLTNSNVTATVNLSNVVADGRYSVSYDISYPAGVNANEITLVHTSSDVVNFYVDKLAARPLRSRARSPATRRTDILPTRAWCSIPWSLPSAGRRRSSPKSTMRLWPLRVRTWTAR